MGGTFWSLDECRWVTWSPGDAPAPALVEGDAIPRQLGEDADQPVVST